MFWVGIVATLVWLITGFIVVVDMIRKSTPLGCLGLVTFPILPFIWVLKWYSGNKKVVGAILYISAILAISSGFFTLAQGKKMVEPMSITARDRVDLHCELNSLRIQESVTEYVMLCESQNIADIMYADVDELVSNYQEAYIDPIIDSYPKELNSNDTAIVIGIGSRSGIVACYQIKTPGVVSKAWHTGEEEPCDH